MLKNYLKIAYRNIVKNKIYSVVNILGLVIALAGCVFILLFVFDELQYDQFHTKKDRIFRYMEQSKTTGETSLIIPACNFPMITNNFPELESGFRIMGPAKQVIGIDNKKFLEDVYFADNEILNVFTFPLLHGDAKTALKEPFSIIITEELAQTYFKDENPVGKIINLKNKYDYKITGVLKNILQTSHIHPSIIASIITLNTTQPSLMEDWHISSCFFYFLVKPNISKELFETKLTARVYEKYGTDWAKSNKVVLEPLPDLYLNPSCNAWDIVNHGDINIVRSFVVIAVLILLMASFNYTNLLTASIKMREKEIITRKILGGGWNDIISQFLFETFLYLCVALVLALAFVELLMDEFNQLTGKLFTSSSLLSPEIIISIPVLLILTAFLSILYPAFIGLRKGSLIRSLGNTTAAYINFPKYSLGFRQIVTGFQFIITIGLLISALVIYSQLNYANNARLGFNKEHLLTIENPWDEKLYDRYESFRNEIIKYPQIVSVSASGNNPSENINSYTFPYLKGKNEKDAIKFAQIAIDYDLLKTWQTKFISGRNFSREMGSDRDHTVIINSSAAKAFNLTDPLNAELNGVNNAADGQKIIGVVEDIHFKSFKDRVMPIVFYLRSWSAANIVVRLSGKDIASTMKMLEKEWNRIMPDRPFIYKFIDESFDNLYQSEQRTEKLIMVFSAFAIVISLLGLFNLISLISQTRKKEIGVRKVLGASVSGIVFMIIKEFIITVIVANIIAVPVAYYVMNNWLKDFAYRIEISWWIFVVSGLIALLVALATVSFQAIKAAVANPVEALRYE